MKTQDKINAMWDKAFDRLERAVLEADAERQPFIAGFQNGFCYALALLHREERMRKKDTE